MVARRTRNLSPLAKHWGSLLVVLGVIVVMMAEPPHQGAGAPSSGLTRDGTPTAITTVTFAPVADAQVAEDNPDFTYGTKPELLVKGGTDPEVASYLRFDVSGLSAPVQRATLRLWVRDKGGSRMARPSMPPTPTGRRPT